MDELFDTFSEGQKKEINELGNEIAKSTYKLLEKYENRELLYVENEKIPMFVRSIILTTILGIVKHIFDDDVKYKEYLKLLLKTADKISVELDKEYKEEN